jgi:hypothetical protein
MPQVQGAIGVGQSAGDQNFAWCRCRHGRYLFAKMGRHYSGFAYSFHPRSG